ncbi:MAG: hypothetical protein LBD95_00130 [Clostridiales Family XIII bacterium]|nr:hypothetical protein [Clostridiales Family XIII bacterium]
MNSIVAKQEELFKEWQETRHYDYFVKDGIFDPKIWGEQKCKLLFVLKEANWEGENVDLRSWIMGEQSPTYWKTWNNIARWTKALLAPGEYPKYVSNADKTYWLSKVAFLNLKKVGGKAIADKKCIQQYAKNDAEFIRKQIILYAPNIIICCGRGTGGNADLLYNEVFKTDELSDWKKPILSYNYFTVSINRSKKIPVVSFYHPQMRRSHELLKKRYEEMIEIGKYLRENELNQ